MAIKGIKEIRILPPLAIGRLGSSPIPMDNYDLVVPDPNGPDGGTGFRKLVPASTFIVDRATGRITKKETPQGKVKFRDANGLIRPICPFLEVWAILDGGDHGDDLVPLTKEHLTDLGLGPSDVAWSVNAVNSKAFRRTGDSNDKVIARLNSFTDHTGKDLTGVGKNFKQGKSIHFGDVQYIEPTDAFPEIRLRFTPAPGKVFGADPGDPGTVDDVYDANKGGWKGHWDGMPGTPRPTEPGNIYYGKTQIIQGTERWVSQGYLDDMCDGTVGVSLPGVASAETRISVGPPDFAPDSLPVRTVLDELEQIAHGPDVLGNVTLEEAVNILRCGLDTVRLMNTEVMNGNPVIVNGKNLNTNNMARQNNRDSGRALEPIFGVDTVDAAAVQEHHRVILENMLQGNLPPNVLSSILREYDKVGDYTNDGRRLMPGMMRNADGMNLALTRRQKSTVTAATENRVVAPVNPPAGRIDPKNRTAQFSYRAQGNPAGTLLKTAVSNNFPGLEFDYRSIWRNIFVGIEMYEAGPFVISVEDHQFDNLQDTVLLEVDGQRVWGEVKGPRSVGGAGVPVEQFSAQGLEWSNAIATVMQKAGQQVDCTFTKTIPGAGTYDDIYNPPAPIKVKMEVRDIFGQNVAGGSAVFANEIVEPGDLTQGLCSPWQNDYRECACYYWAAARPDFVNTTQDANGKTVGDNWLQKNRNGKYALDTNDLVDYLELFAGWEQRLKFIIGGKDDDQ